jgi:hypothetical protein
MPPTTDALQPTPDFTWDPAANPPIAGLRPWRKNSYRLEPEVSGNKFIVHNYGHGGAGITMSWGCAQEVLDIVSARGLPQTTQIAVIGSGVMGMTAATLLAAAQFPVTIYAKEFPPNTTSNVAGGQWAPSLVEHNDDQQFDRILRRAFKTHQSKGSAFGVSPRLNYTLHPAANFEIVPPDIIPAPQHFDHLPFKYLTAPGFAYSTLLVEPPIFLAKLKSDLEAANVKFMCQTFTDANEVLSLNENVIINCTGLGSGTLFQDSDVQPVKGQLVLLPPQLKLNYLYSGHGYLFPRQDAVVVGGTEERHFTTDKPDLPTCQRMLALVRGVFDGTGHPMVAAAEPVPDWFIQNK